MLRLFVSDRKDNFPTGRVQGTGDCNDLRFHDFILAAKLKMPLTIKIQA